MVLATSSLAGGWGSHSLRRTGHEGAVGFLGLASEVWDGLRFLQMVWNAAVATERVSVTFVDADELCWYVN